MIITRPSQRGCYAPNAEATSSAFSAAGGKPSAFAFFAESPRSSFRPLRRVVFRLGVDDNESASLEAIEVATDRCGALRLTANFNQAAKLPSLDSGLEPQHADADPPQGRLMSVGSITAGIVTLGSRWV